MPRGRVKKSLRLDIGFGQRVACQTLLACQAAKLIIGIRADVSDCRQCLVVSARG